MIALFLFVKLVNGVFLGYVKGLADGEEAFCFVVHQGLILRGEKVL
jgi:hypothetical protein